LVVPQLLDGGAGGLAWARVRGRAGCSPRTVHALRDAYRAQARDAVVGECHIEHLVGCLRSGGVEPLLIKGWASARHYAEPGLRPYGDIDLCVRPDQARAAQAILAGAGGRAPVDLHAGIPDLPDRHWDQVLERSEAIPCGTTAVRVPGPEDHLRLLAVHLVRHGGFRPLWLCDVAAAAEAIKPEFDWEYLRRGDPRLSDWALCVIALARRLLGARVDHPAVRAADDRLPLWAVRTVLWRWGTGRERRSLAWYASRPAVGLRALHYHGLNPIRFAFRAGVGPHTRLPLPLVQLAAWGARAPHRLVRSALRRVTPASSFLHRPLAEASRYRPPRPDPGGVRCPPRFQWRRLAGRLAVFALVLALVRNTLFDVYRVAGGSMRPTLVEGDRLVVNQLAFGLNVPFAGRTVARWAGPERGDLVVFRSPADGRTCVKRVAGVPGDRVEIPGTGPVTVPAGRYFVLGDNRDRSADSRFFGWVDGRRIVGRVVGVF
jgi:signal peptidase I